MSSLKGSRYIADPYNDYPIKSTYYPYYPRQTTIHPKQGYCYSEYIPIDKTVIDYEPEYYMYYRPIEIFYTDYREIRHENDYIPAPRVEYDYYPQKTIKVIETNNEPLARTRIDQDKYYQSRVNPPLIRSNAPFDWRVPGPYRSPGYYSSYYSPYKYL